MNAPERYQRYLEQPDYVKTYTHGLAGKTYYSVYLEGKAYGILRRDGHSFFSGGFMSKTRYIPVQYLLISKTNRGFWYDRGVELHTGKLTPEIKESLENALLQADQACPA